MKNIYIIPTDKPSRLGYLTKKGKEVFKDLRLFDKPMPNILDSENQHIHITNDEEIKEGDWIYGLFNGGVIIKSEFDVPKNSQYYKEYGLKIILTTNQSLDGVQAIDDEFLEWFVKNPSCEKAGVINTFDYNKKHFVEHSGYKIIIPKEEPKQEPGKETADYIDRHIVEALVEVAKQKMYSEEDMKSSFQVGFNVGYNDEESPSYLTFEEWIKEYKKK